MATRLAYGWPGMRTSVASGRSVGRRGRRSRALGSGRWGGGDIPDEDDLRGWCGEATTGSAGDGEGHPVPGVEHHDPPGDAAERTGCGVIVGSVERGSIGLITHFLRASPISSVQHRPFGLRHPLDVAKPIGLPEPGPQFRERRSLFSSVARVGLLVPRVASHERLGRVVPGSTRQRARCDHQIPDMSHGFIKAAIFPRWWRPPA
jgi:hypothetical protein